MSPVPTQPWAVASARAVVLCVLLLGVAARAHGERPSAAAPLPLSDDIPAPPTSSDELPVDGARSPSVKTEGVPTCYDERDQSREQRVAGPPDTPCARAWPEIVELYTFAGLFGLGTGAYLIDQFGWNDRDDDSDDAAAAITLLVPAVAAIFAVNRADAEVGLDPGVPSAIAAGLQLGFLDGILFAGAVHPEGDPLEGGGGRLIWGGTTLGGAFGLLTALALEPTPVDAFVVRSAALWGTFLSSIVARLARVEDEPDAFRLALAGGNAALMAGAVATAYARPTPAQLLRLNVGGVVGALLSAAVLSGGPPDDDVRDVGLLLGTLGGMALGQVLLGLGEDADAAASGLPTDARPPVSRPPW